MRYTFNGRGGIRTGNRPARKRKLTGYRVDIKINETGAYAEYTSLKIPVTRAMAVALGLNLKRQGSAGRIVAVPSGEMIESWEGR